MKMSALFADEDITVGHVILEPGERLAEEIHVAMSETIVILRGKIVIELPDREVLCWVPLKLADLPYGAGMHHQYGPIVPHGTPHAVTNVTPDDGVAEYIAIMRRVPKAGERRPVSAKTTCPRCTGPAVVVDKAPPGESGDVIRCEKEETCVALSNAASRLSDAKDAVSDLAAEVVNEGFPDSGKRALEDTVRDWRKAGNDFLAAVAAHGRTN